MAPFITPLIISLIVQAFACAWLSSIVAEQKGHSKEKWGPIGFLCGILGLIAVAGLPDRASMKGRKQPKKSCGKCAMEINAPASLCPYCGENFRKGEVLESLIGSLESWGEEGTHAIESLHRMKLPGTSDAARRLLGHETIGTLNSVILLGKLKDIESVDMLLKILVDPSLGLASHESMQVDIARQAAVALGEIGEITVVSPLLDLFGKSVLVEDLVSQTILSIGEDCIPVLREISLSGPKNRKKAAISLMKKMS